MKIKLSALALGLLLATTSSFAASSDMPVKGEKKHHVMKKAKKHAKVKKSHKKASSSLESTK